MNGLIYFSPLTIQTCIAISTISSMSDDRLKQFFIDQQIYKAKKLNE